MPIAQRLAEELGLDTDHLNHRRRWTDDELRKALETESSWKSVATALGLSELSNTVARLKGHALRLGLDTSRLEKPNEVEPNYMLAGVEARVEELRHAAPSIAAAWFRLRGYAVAVPVTDQPYDLLVLEEGSFQRVQVKSTTYVAPNGRWQVGIGHRPYALDNTATKAPYDPDSIDLFFIVTSRGDAYVIPIAPVAGLTNIYLDRFDSYRVGDVSGLLN